MKLGNSPAIDILIPPAEDRFFILPDDLPPVDSALSAAIHKYRAQFNRTDDDVTGAEWAAAASAIAEHKPTSGIDLAIKILFVAHYAQPDQVEDRLAIDLGSFDADTGRMLLRCAQDVLRIQGGR